MSFTEFSNQYQNLRSQLDAGLLSPQQFSEAVDQLKFQAEDGIWWQINAANGAWLRWNGTSWNQVQPPKTQSKKKRSKAVSCLALFGIGLLVLVCLLVVIGGGGYLMIASGNLSYVQLTNLIGPGMGDIGIVNLDLVEIQADLTRLDTVDGNPEGAGNLTLESLDMGSLGGIESGRYQLEIRATNGGTCTLEIIRGDKYQFVVVPEGVAVSRIGESAQTTEQINMATSSWCQK